MIVRRKKKKDGVNAGGGGGGGGGLLNLKITQSCATLSTYSVSRIFRGRSVRDVQSGQAVGIVNMQMTVDNPNLRYDAAGLRFSLSTRPRDFLYFPSHPVHV